MLTPDTQLFLNQNCHQEALNTLILALVEGEGFIKVVGEVGTGKTILCRMLLAKLHSAKFTTAYIPNPWLTPAELKNFVASEIGVQTQENMQSHQLTSAIYRRLVQIARQGKQTVLLIDEAQAMPRDTLESLRLLTNLEGEKRKLLQVVIFGQPELDVLLSRKDLRQLQQRIAFSERLTPLSHAATADYIRFRVTSCGGQRNLFNSSALWMIAVASSGIPRLINILAHKAMMSAYGKRDKAITGWHTAKAVLDTGEASSQGRWAARLWVLKGHQQQNVEAAL